MKQKADSLKLIKLANLYIKKGRKYKLPISEMKSHLTTNSIGIKNSKDIL